MNILILGATGFIGNGIFHSLIADYTIITAGRTPISGYNNHIHVDFNNDNDWDKLLEGIDLVVNAIGIIEGDFQKIQTETPIQLYKTCIKRKVKILHISAISAEKGHPLTPFLQTKKVTDDFLLQYEEAKVIYPGVVLGKHGRSSQFFAEIAQFPIIPLFNNKPIPLVHISQLTKLIKQIIKDFNSFSNQIFAIAKPEPLPNVFSALKGKKGKFIQLPSFLFQFLFTLFPNANIGIFNRDTFKLFQQSSMDGYQPLFDEKASQHIDSNNTIKSNVFPLLFALLAVSFIWIWSGVSSLISWNESYSIMNEIGANHQFSVLFIYMGSIADILLGIAVFSEKHRRKIIVLQVLIMLIYMLILTIAAPHYWLHPFGVLSKNIPLLALSYYIFVKSKKLEE
jgi:uncharacterized protein YbjT (DUF2867 family)